MPSFRSDPFATQVQGMEQLTHSAALYCDPEPKGHVSLAWLDGALTLLRSHGLRVREYSLGDNPVCSAGSYAFRDNDPQLLAAIQTGSLRFLDLYCHSKKRRHLLMNWEGVATISLPKSYVHVGVLATSGLSVEELLRRSYALAKPFGPWRYGIGYARSAQKAPCMYALGIGGGARYPDPTETEEDRERIGCWYRELLFASRRRHLHGYFRDVYPANLLSAKHVKALVGKNKKLLTAGLGELTPLDEEMWLWTVPEEEIPKARVALKRAKRLLCA